MFRPNGRVYHFEHERPHFMTLASINRQELFAEIVAHYTFDLSDIPVLHFIDNTTALSWAIRGYSPDADVAELLNTWHLRLAARQQIVWFDYVPSHANVADQPSRGILNDTLRELNSVEVTTILPPTSPAFFRPRTDEGTAQQPEASGSAR